MFNKLKAATAALALTVAAGSASAATVTGSISFAGSILTNTTNIAAGGNVDINEAGNTATILSSGADLAGLDVTIADFDLTTTGVTLLSLSNGIEFVVGAFAGFFTDGAESSFTAIGELVGGGFETTVATFSLSSADTDLNVTDFYVAELTAVDDNVAPVPVPAAGFLLVGALGGLTALRRRKAAK